MFRSGGRFLFRFSRSRTALVGAVVAAVIVILGLLSGVLAPYDPFVQSDAILAPPSWTHWLGTDLLGRDILSRVLEGARVSTYFAVGVGVISIVVGIVVGAISGYFGGWIDHLLSRTVEFFLMIPNLFLVVLLVALFGGGNLLLAMVVVGLLSWPTNARIIRAQVLSVKKREFVESAIVTGAGSLSVLFRHVVPNSLTVVIANSTVQMASAILTEAALSFLGLGDPNRVSWGQMIYDSQSSLQEWWTWAAPGIAITTYVLALNLIGDGIGNALNPRLALQAGRQSTTHAATGARREERPSSIRGAA